MRLSNLIKFFTILLLSLYSCTKAIEIDEPANLLITPSVFENDNTARSALAGIYSEMMRPRYFLTSGAMTIYPGMSADELSSTLSNSTRDVFRDNELLSGNSIVRNDIWRIAYFNIYRANACIDGLTQSHKLTPGVKSQLLGESHFIRAFNYFYLVNLYGEVPLVLTTDYNTNSKLPRSSVNQVYEWIISDLKEARQLMAEEYSSDGRVRPNRHTATALLARVYLYKEDFPNAEAEASEIINSNLYSLATDLTQVFVASSPETIWQLMPVLQSGGNNTHEGFLFVPARSSTVPAFSVSKSLLNAFEPDDLRKSSWIGVNNAGGRENNYPYKYKIRTNFPDPAEEYNVVFRLAEQFLIRAEARARQDKLDEARTDLDTIRSRAGLPPTLAVEKEELLAAIEHERQIELAFEWGHRWFDLKRNGRADAVLSVVKGATWQSMDVLYPIPFAEIQLNQSLTQNPGY